MVFNNLWVQNRWTNVALALEGLKHEWVQFNEGKVKSISNKGTIYQPCTPPGYFWLEWVNPKAAVTHEVSFHGISGVAQELSREWQVLNSNPLNMDLVKLSLNPLYLYIMVSADQVNTNLVKLSLTLLHKSEGWPGVLHQPLNFNPRECNLCDPCMHVRFKHPVYFW